MVDTDSPDVMSNSRQGTQPILKVAVSVPLSTSFDYLPPAGSPAAVPGSRVRVPFGRRRQVGLVIDHVSATGLPADKIRRCIENLDDDPLLSGDDLWLIRFTSDYYHHPIGEVAAAALPALLRQGKALNPVIQCVAVTDAGEAADIESLAKRAPRQAELLELLLDAGGNGVDEDALTELVPTWRRAAKALFEKGLAHRFSTRADEEEPAPAGPGEPGPELHDAQRQALDAIRGSE